MLILRIMRRLFLTIMVVAGSLICQTTYCQEELKLFIGQDMGAIGGFESPNDHGYIDEMGTDFDGVTTYTSFPSLAGLDSKTNYGSGDICATCLLENEQLKGKSIAIGLYMVDQLESINRGEQDSQIGILADWIKESERTVFLRIGYEFDGNWNHYDPEQYKLAFKRIMDAMRKNEVTNVVSVWQACTSPIDEIVEGKKENIEDWYPGDDYVDMMGLSWFLNNEVQYELSNELLDLARQHKKSVMICESTPQGYDLEERKKKNIVSILDGEAGVVQSRKTPDEIWQEWYVPFFEFIKNNQDVISSVAYINVRWDSQPMWGTPYSQGYWGDSRVQSNKKIKEMWLQQWFDFKK
jgi:hypothetical protein